MLSLLASLYAGAVRARNLLYDTGVFEVRKAGVPVVSVGNIEAGGTGKTPFTIALARELSVRGLHPAIVTRGYKGRLKGVVEVRPGHDFRDVGDEALLMARVSGVPVVKSPDRFSGAVYAREALNADVVLLDDGFQHRKLHRDLDIVLLSRDVSRCSLLPAGPLREPAEALGRADIVVHTKGSSGDGITADLHPTALVDASGRLEGLASLEDMKVLAVSGIARPEYFTAILEELGATAEPLSFRDHHAFTARDIEEIRERSKGFDLVVTTEKDLVRLPQPAPADNWLALRVEMRVTGMETIIREVEGIVFTSGVPRQG